MFDKNASIRFKRTARVTMTLAGQEPVEATVFLSVDERLIDLLNDSRAFIPTLRADGSIAIVAKTSIVSIIEAPDEVSRAVDEEAAETAQPDADPEPEAKEPPKPPPERPRRHFDPYDVLRVPRGAAIDEVRRAYKARMKAVHPDALAGLELDEDLERAAILAAQKVNHAYQTIMRDLKDTAKASGDAA